MSWHAISVVCFRLIHNLGLKHSFQITFPAAFVNHPGYFLQTYVINSRQSDHFTALHSYSSQLVVIFSIVNQRMKI